MAVVGSDEWLDEAGACVVPLPTDTTVSMTVEGSPVAKKVSWHEVHADGVVTLGSGTLKGADLVLSAKWADWWRLLDGEASAAAQFMRGRLKMSGDATRWLEILPSLDAPDAIDARRRLAELTDRD